MPICLCALYLSAAPGDTPDKVGPFGPPGEDCFKLVDRARELWGAVVSPEDAIVVGDTPRDVACGKAGGTRTLAVATGSFSLAELAASEPDHVIEDMSSTMDVLDLLVG